MYINKMIIIEHMAFKFQTGEAYYMLQLERLEAWKTSIKEQMKALKNAKDYDNEYDIYLEIGILIEEDFTKLRLKNQKLQIILQKTFTYDDIPASRLQKITLISRRVHQIAKEAPHSWYHSLYNLSPHKLYQLRPQEFQDLKNLASTEENLLRLDGDISD